MDVVMNRTKEHWLFTWTVNDAKGKAHTYFVSEHHINVQSRPDEKELTSQIFNALYQGIPVHVHAAYDKETHILTIKPAERDVDAPVATQTPEQRERATTDYFRQQEQNLKNLCAQTAIFKELGVV